VRTRHVVDNGTNRSRRGRCDSNASQFSRSSSPWSAAEQRCSRYLHNTTKQPCTKLDASVMADKPSHWFRHPPQLLTEKWATDLLIQQPS